MSNVWILAVPARPPDRRGTAETGGTGSCPGTTGSLIHHPQVCVVRAGLSLRTAGSGQGVLHVARSVLDLLAGLLDVGLALVGLALGLEVLVVRGAAEGFLDLALGLFGLVLELVVGAHL